MNPTQAERAIIKKEKEIAELKKYLELALSKLYARMQNRELT